MIYCKKCGAQLNDDARFCAQCGNPIDKTIINNSLHSGSKQMLIRFRGEDYQKINKYLNEGWVIDDFKIINEDGLIWTYGLLRKE